MEIAAAFVNRYPHSNLILTLGKKGSLFINGTAYLEQPIYSVRAVDTTAAGDTFTGYFLAALTGGADAASALRLAAKAAALAVSRHGASTSIPTRSEVDAWNQE